MAHQDFSEICPIFNEGVEKEMTIPIKTTASLSVAQGYIPMGREVEFLQAYAIFTTGSLSTTAACIMGIYKNTLSTQLGSINCTQSAFIAATDDVMPQTIVGEITTSVPFTSTDVLCIAMTTKSTGVVYKPSVVLRYRDK